MNKNLLVTIYHHPESFPPTLNALSELSKIFQSVDLLHRPLSTNKWCYPDNVALHPSGHRMDSKVQENKPFFFKILYLLIFSYNMIRLIWKKKPQCIIVYDSVALLSLYLCYPFTFYKPILWYHSHDVIDLKYIKPISIMNFSKFAENTFLRRFDVLSIPSLERLKNFNLSKFTGKVFHLPNYPSLELVDKDYRKSKYGDSKFRLIYQGTVSRDHGIIELISSGIMHLKQIDSLLIIGYCDPDLKRELEKLIKENNVEEKVAIKNKVDYRTLMHITGSYDIGIATIKPVNVAYSTAATASNKIYEYASHGLPVLYYDDIHYNLYLGKYDWAFATDLSYDSLLNCITYITANYDNLAKSAKNDFIYELNFENYFSIIISHLNIILNNKN